MANGKNKKRRVLTTATAKHSVSCPCYFVKVLKGTGNPISDPTLKGWACKGNRASPR